MCSPWNIKDVKEGGSGEIFRKPVKLLILLPFWGSLPSLMGFKQPLNKYQREQDFINMFHVNPWFVLNKQADLLGGNVRNILMVPNFRGWSAFSYVSMLSGIGLRPHFWTKPHWNLDESGTVRQQRQQWQQIWNHQDLRSKHVGFMLGYWCRPWTFLIF